MSDFDDNKSLSSKGVGLKRDPNAALGSWVVTPSARPQKNPFLQPEVSTTPSSSTTISEDVSIKGELRFPLFLRIDGHFEGKLSSEGKLHVGPKGVVHSDLNLKSATIEGRVEGNIVVSERLELAATASVKGDISCQILKIEEGATLTGIVTVQPKNND